MESTTKDFLLSLIIAIILALFINFFIFSLTKVNGVSMEPSLVEGDRLLVVNYERFLKTRDYQRGDIIVFKSPHRDGKKYVKRLIGLPGDTINIVDGEVFVNGDQIKEDYLGQENYTLAMDYGLNYKVPDGSYFYIGDNRGINQSHDSRDFGAIPKSSIRGRAIWRFYPFDKVTKL